LCWNFHPWTWNNLKVKINDSIATTRNVFHDFVQSLTNFLNNSSADYRSITTQLASERKQHSGLTNNPNVIPIVEAPEKNLLEVSESSSSKVGDDADTWALIDNVEDSEESWKKDHCAVSCVVAFYYALLANTDWLCYTLMIVNHMYYASMLSVPLPFFVFLWGMLSIPRPTKRFWIAIITYVELVIVIKYIFQFQFPQSKNMNFNECQYEYYGPKVKDSPLCPPRIIGIERGRDSSVCDLLLLLALFLHRSSLKIHGLWREKSFFDEEDATPCSSQATGTIQDNTNVGFDDVKITESITPQLNRPFSVHSKRSVLRNMKNFLLRIRDPEIGTGAVDVYAWMFGSQFIVFLDNFCYICV
jgi:hypothetical protein